jgi:hypothetical protein
MSATDEEIATWNFLDEVGFRPVRALIGLDGELEHGALWHVPGGYGMYTKRVVADGDPADPSAPKPLAAGGGGARGRHRPRVL